MNLVSYSNPQVCTRSMRGQRGIRSQVEAFSLVNATVELTRRMVLYSYALDFYNSIIGILLVWKRKLGQRASKSYNAQSPLGQSQRPFLLYSVFPCILLCFSKEKCSTFLLLCTLYGALGHLIHGIWPFTCLFFMFYIGLISAIDTIFSSKFPCLDTGAGCRYVWEACWISKIQSRYHR